MKSGLNMFITAGTKVVHLQAILEKIFICPKKTIASTAQKESNFEGTSKFQIVFKKGDLMEEPPH